MPVVDGCSPKYHDWQPIPRWSGRYRCSECGAIGYRGIAVCGDMADASDMSAERLKEIVPYVCSVRDCHLPAIGISRKRTSQYEKLCKVHLPMYRDRLRKGPPRRW